MAKASKKKQSTSEPRVWKPEPDDAIRLAALRWFALSLERLSIEIYATDKGQYEAIEDLFRVTLKKLGRLRHRIAAEAGDCPNGYVLCDDGLCAPMCDGELSDQES
jgi:hypothetical protein